ncbi:response regulator [Gemmatimonadota bacterium]
MTEFQSRRSEILLVEDNLSDATLIRTLLEQDENTRVTLAQDGIRGCQLAEHQRWDLVITDLNLPGRDGVAVIQTSKAHQPDTPIIATSAYSEPHQRDGAFRAGATEVLPKPLDGGELVEVVRSLLRLTASTPTEPSRVLAISPLPGDAEAGCGGVLLKRAANGVEVHTLVLSTGAGGPEGHVRRTAAERAAKVIGARLILNPKEEVGLPDLEQMLVRVQDAVHELSPDVILAPSPRDVRESRRNAYRAAELAGSEVPGFFCYQAATTTLEFRPTLFEDISEFLDQKMAALSHFEAQIRGRPHLDPELARASARYWGRFLGYREVEPFEVLRQVI